MGEPKSVLEPIKEKIGFIGGGNMAKAICEGMIQKGLSYIFLNIFSTSRNVMVLLGLVVFKQIYVSGPNIENLTWWVEKGANVYTQNGRVVEHADVIFLAMKPHILPSAIANVHETLNLPVKSKLFVSILAGVTLEQLENASFRELL